MHKISNRIFEIFFKKTLDFLLAGFRFIFRFKMIIFLQIKTAIVGWQYTMQLYIQYKSLTSHVCIVIKVILLSLDV